MSSIIKVNPPILTQIEDRLSWVAGNNPVTFRRAYPDTDYAFEAHAPGVLVTVVSGSRTVGGLTVNVDIDTDEGYFEANGNTNDYASGFYYASTDTKVLRGSQTLVTGENIVLLPDDGFEGVDYTVAIEDEDIRVYVKPDSKAQDQFIVVSSDDNIYFTYTAIGV